MRFNQSPFMSHSIQMPNTLIYKKNKKIHQTILNINSDLNWYWS